MQTSEGPLKIVMLGEGRVGKTSLTLRFCKDQFDDKQESTINATYLEKPMDLGGGKAATLSIWDTAGQEKFHAMTPMYYRDALGAVLVYDVTFKESFIRVEKWVEELRLYGRKDIEIVIAGNKCDMKHSIQITQQEAEAYAQSKGAKHFLTSAKSNIGIDTMFSNLTGNILAKLSQSKRGKKKSGLVISEQGQKPKKSEKKDGCC